MVKPDMKRPKEINAVTEDKSLTLAKFLRWNNLAMSTSRDNYYHCDITTLAWRCTVIEKSTSLYFRWLVGSLLLGKLILGKFILGRLRLVLRRLIYYI